MDNTILAWIARLAGLVILLVALLLLAIEFAPPTWLAKNLEEPLGKQLNAQVSLESLDVHILSASPSVSLTNAAVQAKQMPDNQATASLGTFTASISLGSLLRGKLFIKELIATDGQISATVDSAGQGNWSYLMPDSDERAVSEPESGQAATQAIPAIEKMRVQNLRIEFTHEPRTLSGDLTINASASSTENVATMADVSGSVNQLPVQGKLRMSSLTRVLEHSEALDLDVAAMAGQSKLELKGAISDIEALQGIDIEFSTAVPRFSDIEALTGLELPQLPPLALSGTLKNDGDELVLHRFDGLLGDSDLQGDVRINPSTTPITLYANLITQSLDLDDLAGLIGGEPDPTETISSDQLIEADESDDNEQKILTDEPIELAALNTLFNGAIQYKARSIRTPDWPLQSLNLRAQIDDGVATIEPLSVGVADGEIAGSIIMDSASQPIQGEISLSMQRLNLTDILSSAGIDDDSFGILGGRLKYWVQGNSLASMAANADGGMFLLMTQGRLDALLVELAGADLVESLTLLLASEKSRTDVQCAYLDLQTDDGVSDVATLVLDTADTVFLGDGFIDLNDESIDLTIEPHPKDISIVATQTAAHIKGTLSQPSIRPGRTLYARAAAAAILGTLATPAAGLLPFIEAGTGSDSAYCEGMITALDDAR